MDYRPIELKMEELIKKIIRDEGLVKTGKLLNSISVKYSNDTFSVSAEDYYLKLDEKYKITEQALGSPEFTSWLGDYMASQIEKNI